MSPYYVRMHRLTLLTITVIVVFGLVDVFWLPRSNLTMSSENYLELGRAALIVCICYLVALGANRRLSRDNSKIAGRIRHAALSLLILLRFAALFIPLGFVCSVYMYLASASGYPLMDAELARLDAMLGFDWQAFLSFCNDRPWLASILVYAYHSVGPQMPLLVLLLAVMKCEDGLREFLALVAVTSLFTAIGLALVPAAGAYAHFMPPAEAFSSFTREAGMWHYGELMKLRSGEEFLFSTARSQGLVTFPSYHTALGLIIIYAVRGVRLVFPAILATNLIMIAATLPEGGHYLIDVIAGAMLGAAAILLVRLCAHRTLQLSAEPGTVASFKS